MKLEDKETIQRALGIIEGISCGVSNELATGLIDAVQMIDEVLEGVKVDYA